MLSCCLYFRHTDEMIQRLELAGLGYRVTADKTKDRIGAFNFSMVSQLRKV